MGFGDGSFIPNEKDKLQTFPQKELQWWQVDGMRGSSLRNELKAEKKILCLTCNLSSVSLNINLGIVHLLICEDVNLSFGLSNKPTSCRTMKLVCHCLLLAIYYQKETSDLSRLHLPYAVCEIESSEMLHGCAALVGRGTFKQSSWIEWERCSLFFYFLFF